MKKKCIIPAIFMLISVIGMISCRQTQQKPVSGISNQNTLEEITVEQMQQDYKQGKYTNVLCGWNC